MQEDALAFFSRALQALRTESVPNAGRWIGALLHFTEDCGSPAVAADISGDLRGKLEALVARRPFTFRATSRSCSAGPRSRRSRAFKNAWRR
jgi:hypothetical protein